MSFNLLYISFLSNQSLTSGQEITFLNPLQDNINLKYSNKQQHPCFRKWKQICVMTIYYWIMIIYLWNGTKPHFNANLFWNPSILTFITCNLLIHTHRLRLEGVDCHSFKWRMFSNRCLLPLWHMIQFPWYFYPMKWETFFVSV